MHIMERESTLRLRLPRGEKPREQEKNWTPLHTPAGQLLFIYEHSPLRVLGLHGGADAACSGTGQGAMRWEVVPENATNTCGRGVRGGSPYVLWRWPYYVSLAHESFICRDAEVGAALRKRLNVPKNVSLNVYRGVLAVLNLETFSLACSEPLYFEPPSSTPVCSTPARRKNVQYPLSLVLEEDGSALAGVEFEDACPALLRIPARELELLVESALGPGL